MFKNKKTPINSFDERFLKNRAFIIDWLIQLKNQIEYSNETLFLSVNILDKVLLSLGDQINAEKIHLMAMISIFIAGKYLEVTPVLLDDFIEKICHMKFEKKIILEFEWKILRILKFKMPSNTFYDFINKVYDRVVKVSKLKQIFLDFATSTYIFSMYNFNLTNFVDPQILFYSIFFFSLKTFIILGIQKISETPLLKRIKKERIDEESLKEVQSQIDIFLLSRKNEIFHHFLHYEMEKVYEILNNSL